MFAPQILHKPLFLNAPGGIAFSQEHFKTISYVKFGGQTECIMGNSKIVNRWWQGPLEGPQRASRPLECAVALDALETISLVLSFHFRVSHRVRPSNITADRFLCKDDVNTWNYYIEGS